LSLTMLNHQNWWNMMIYPDLPHKNGDG
jgi:hypothetical protein